MSDLVVVNSGTNSIGIFLNYGNQTFSRQLTVTTGNSSRSLSVVVGDFNNDTHLDIAVANYDTHNTGIFLGYGNGTVASQTQFLTSTSRPVSMAVGDLNNDGCLDIVITNNGTDNIRILSGYGNGSFGNQITYSTGYDSLPYGIVVGNFNNDHYLDIAVANYGTDNVGVFLGAGNESFTSQITYSTGLRSNPYAIALSDFNNDSYLDIVVANVAKNNVGILLGFGNGSFLPQKTYSSSPGSRPCSIIIGDFNGDNQLDVAVSNYHTSDISVLIGFNNGSFAIPTIHSVGIDSNPVGMTAGDFDNDNQSDIAVVNYGTNNVIVLTGYGIRQSDDPTTYSTGIASLPNQIAIGDLNNDTKLDLVVVDYGSNDASIFIGYGDGSFQDQIAYSTGDGSAPFALTVADMDNDHQLDIVVGYSNTESLGILYGYGNGTFDSVVTYFTGNLSSLRSLIVDDFNNDNHFDIAFADYFTDSFGILFGFGDRTFVNLTKYSCGDHSHPFFIAAGDFNNDGQSDIAIANYGTNNIVIFLGSRNGTFTLTTICSTGVDSLPYMITIADLNKDNNLDIIVANSGTSNVGIFFGLGNSSFTIQMTYSTGSNSWPSWICVDDFNTDGWLDLAVANSNNNNVGILLGASYGYFGNQTIYSTGSDSAPNSIVVGDINKDNRLDVAVANFGTNNVAILLGHLNKNSINQSNSTIATDNVPVLLGDYYANFSSETTYSTGSSSRPYSIAAGDLNSDTYMDLVVVNSGNESIGVLLGFGNGTFATETIYSVGVGSSPQDVIINDFNNDNQLDVAVTNPKNDNVIVLLGSSNGTFSTSITYSTDAGSNPSTLASGNFDNDNYLDLAVTNKGTDTIGIFFGFDYTSFARQKSCATGENSKPASVTIADFNNDGHLDIVSALYTSNNVAIFLGFGDGTFTPVMTFSNVDSSQPWSVAAADFNNDTNLDITVANSGTDNIAILLGYGNGSFTDPILYSTGPAAASQGVAVADFNNDKCLDIVVANYGQNTLAVLFGYGNGAFGTLTTFSTGENSEPSSVIVSDVNNDAHSDIIVTNLGNSNIGILLGYGNGSFERQITFSTGDNSHPWSVIAGDFNKDKYVDLAIANYGTSNIGVLYGCGNGTFGNLQTYTTGTGSNPTKVNVADFNNDNLLDIIVSDETKNASISTIPLDSNSFTYDAAAGDFNNDSFLDFATADYGNNNIVVFLAHGSKPFGGQTTFNVGEGSHPSSIAVGHFNNDSRLDLAITNSGTNNIGILLGFGNRMFSNITTYSTGDDSLPLSLAVDDFNNDSFTDIVVANSKTNNIVVLIGRGDGRFSTYITYSIGASSQPVSTATGDFNRDHQVDIAVANYGTNNVCILFGSGNATFTNQIWYPLGYDSRPNWIIFKDLNNDGWEDIAVATYGIDNINILLNLC